MTWREDFEEIRTGWGSDAEDGEPGWRDLARESHTLRLFAESLAERVMTVAGHHGTAHYADADLERLWLEAKEKARRG